ncbi:MAG: GNAT family N-acetyltransferase [Pseudomonadota bacterium]
MNKINKDFQRDGKSPLRYHLRYARPEDLQQMNSVCRVSKAHWGYDDNFLEKAHCELRVPLTLVLSNQVMVADNGKEIIAVGGIENEADDTFTVSHLYVDPNFMGQGIGAAIFAGLSALASGLGGQLLSIVSDPNAVVFYEKMGASVVGEEKSASETGRVLPLMHLPLVKDG